MNFTGNFLRSSLFILNNYIIISILYYMDYDKILVKIFIEEKTNSIRLKLGYIFDNKYKNINPIRGFTYCTVIGIKQYITIRIR